MIGYVTVGTNDIERAGRFYDALLGEMGAGRAMESDRFIAWASAPGATMLLVMKPFDEQAAAPGNGTMIALAAGNQENVDKLHAKALSLGAQNEGDPGPRGDGFYGGYFRDPDNNKLALFHMG